MNLCRWYRSVVVLVCVTAAVESQQPLVVPKVTPDMLGPLSASELPELAKRVAPDRPESTRYQAYTRMARIPSSVDLPERENLFVEGMDDASSSIRLACVKGLAGAVEERAPMVVEALTKALDDEDFGVVATAANALGRFGAAATGALPRLEELLRKGMPKPPAASDPHQEALAVLGAEPGLSVRWAAAGARAKIAGADIDIDIVTELDLEGREAWAMAMMAVVEPGFLPVLLERGVASPPKPALQQRYVDVLAGVATELAAKVPAGQAAVGPLPLPGNRDRHHVEELVSGLARFAALSGTFPAAHDEAAKKLEEFAEGDDALLRQIAQACRRPGGKPR